jgi:hypothetical protein
MLYDIDVDVLGNPQAQGLTITTLASIETQPIPLSVLYTSEMYV